MYFKSGVICTSEILLNLSKNNCFNVSSILSFYLCDKNPMLFIITVNYGNYFFFTRFEIQLIFNRIKWLIYVYMTCFYEKIKTFKRILHVFVNQKQFFIILLRVKVIIIKFNLI